MPYSFHISGSSLWVTITGAENTDIDDINHTLRTLDQMNEGKTYQLFDADKITDQYHIYYAAANAYNAMKTGNNISNKLDVETLLYASTQNQISKAIKLIGVSKQTQQIAVAVISEIENDPTATKIAEHLGDPTDTVLELTPTKYSALKALFEVSDNAIEAVGGDKNRALTSLITEKSALISLRR